MEQLKMIEELLKKLATSGDIAAAGLGFAAGFVADVFLFPTGIPPATVASVSLVGAVGLKKAADVWWNGRKDRAPKKNAAVARSPWDTEELEARAERLKNYIEGQLNSPSLYDNEDAQQQFTKLHGYLSEQVRLWETDIIDNKEFADGIKLIRKLCLERAKTVLRDALPAQTQNRVMAELKASGMDLPSNSPNDN